MNSNFKPKTCEIFVLAIDILSVSSVRFFYIIVFGLRKDVVWIECLATLKFIRYGRAAGESVVVANRLLKEISGCPKFLATAS